MEEAKVERDARRLTVLGGAMGLLAAAVLGSFRLLGDDGPVMAEGLFGDTVFALVYMSPYLLTLVAARTAQPSARGGLLMALGTLSLIASFSTFSLVTVILLPATGAIFMAAAWSFRTPGRRVVLVPLYLAAGLISGAAIAFSFIALFALEADEARCWTLTRGGEGAEEWHSRPNEGARGRLMIESGQNDIRGTCTSDIITNSEGARSLGILSVGALLFIGTARLRVASS
jgi:hypothetical protein